MKTYDSPPANLQSLQARVAQQELGQDDANRRHFLMAMVVVSQMMPEGMVIRGGSAMVLRYGTGVRRTTDVDSARALAEDDVLDLFEENLRDGWAGFTGVLKQLKKPSPRDVPSDYVTSKFQVKLGFRGKSWKSVDFELAQNEIGSAASSHLAMPDELVNLFTAIGLPAPEPAPVMGAEYQVAQKIHALTSPGSERAHDLVDLQLLEKHEAIDLGQTKLLCERLFRYRQRQAWPPMLTPGQGWKELYDTARASLRDPADVADYDGALCWFGRFLEDIVLCTTLNSDE